MKLRPGQRVMNKYSGWRYVVDSEFSVSPSLQGCERWATYVVYECDHENRHYLQRTRDVLWVLCKNCDMPRKEHAEHKKCSYGPGYWEES